jgi:hypothetical protein
MWLQDYCRLRRHYITQLTIPIHVDSIIRINTAAMLSDDSGGGLLRETTDAPFTISRHDFYSLFAAYMACVRDKQQDYPDSSKSR